MADTLKPEPLWTSPQYGIIIVINDKLWMTNDPRGDLLTWPTTPEVICLANDPMANDPRGDLLATVNAPNFKSLSLPVLCLV